MIVNYVKLDDVRGTWLESAAIWVIYRIVKGWLNLYDNRPMYVEGAPPASPPSV